MSKEQDYVPFGPEWEKEVGKMSKLTLIQMYASVCKQLQKDRSKPLPSSVPVEEAAREWFCYVCDQIVLDKDVDDDCDHIVCGHTVNLAHQPKEKGESDAVEFYGWVPKWKEEQLDLIRVIEDGWDKKKAFIEMGNTLKDHKSLYTLFLNSKKKNV